LTRPDVKTHPFPPSFRRFAPTEYPQRREGRPSQPLAHEGTRRVAEASAPEEEFSWALGYSCEGRPGMGGRSRRLPSAYPRRTLSAVPFCTQGALSCESISSGFPAAYSSEDGGLDERRSPSHQVSAGSHAAAPCRRPRRDGTLDTRGIASSRPRTRAGFSSTGTVGTGREAARRACRPWRGERGNVQGRDACQTP
jgi:hypothetical protein